MRIRRRVAAVALLVALAGCQRGEPVPPPADDATIKQRVVDYFRKSVTQTGLTFTVTRLEDSDLPGWRRGTLQVALGQQTQEVPFQVSRDGRFLFRGEVVDLTVDPVRQVLSRIALDGAPSRGPAAARVTIVEYSDFQCPFCARAYATVENQVLRTYGDKVRFVFKNFPLTTIHPWAEDAAIATRCAFTQGNDRFWALYHALFTNQTAITRDNFRDRVTELAGTAGIDVGRLGTCLDGKATLGAVKADQAEATALGVTSTPTFFVNGRRLSGAQTFESFKQMIDQELTAGAPG